MDKVNLLSDQPETAKEPFPGQHLGAENAEAPRDAYGESDGASAPPVDLMDTVPGYEGMGTENNDLPPPYPALVQPEMPSPNSTERHWEIPSISEDLAKEALLEYASSKCCYSTKPAKELVFSELQVHNTYRYRLETFTESRSKEWDSEPYNGQFVDAYGGVVPGPWELAVPVPALFKKNKTSVRVPHTSSVKGCHSCLALGRSACQKCITSGRMQCWVCNGSGMHLSDRRCHHCNGIGRVKCTSCGGVGSQTCSTCRGKGQLLCYLKLVVKWTNNVNECVVDKKSGFPVDRVSQVTGETVFSDTNPLVYPITGFPDNAINHASYNAVTEHQARFLSTCRILQQRQTIELIPITRVHYTWKGKTHIFFVYGAEHKVHTDDYPAKCCCCSLI
ncbi:protein SSUH2 homolog isoform X2 [Amia ocellicauda]|uniref:protein SSUH2 homolog isoform X2 n=1 Tax=Amia ocellicauda TaxID=2972642 RepID=UPI003464D09B